MMNRVSKDPPWVGRVASRASREALQAKGRAEPRGAVYNPESLLFVLGPCGWLGGTHGHPIP
jgi:hypothetical protein